MRRQATLNFLARKLIRSFNTLHSAAPPAVSTSPEKTAPLPHSLLKKNTTAACLQKSLKKSVPLKIFLNKLTIFLICRKSTTHFVRNAAASPPHLRSQKNSLPSNGKPSPGKAATSRMRIKNFLLPMAKLCAQNQKLLLQTPYTAWAFPTDMSSL